MHVYEKIALFAVSRFISETIQDKTIIIFEMLVRTRMRTVVWCYFLWSWATLSDIAKYSVTRNITRPPWDSWASCLEVYRRKDMTSIVVVTDRIWEVSNASRAFNDGTRKSWTPRRTAPCRERQAGCWNWKIRYTVYTE